MEWVWGYFLVVSLLAAGMTVADKLAAKRGGRRIAERTLLLVAALGGALAEWAVMTAIRHKTRHGKFMIGLPLLACVHVALLGAAVIFAMMERI